MVVLYRIDNRLIHGQVLEGWLPLVKANMIVVVSDDYASDAARQRVVTLTVPQEVGVVFWTIKQAAHHLAAIEADADKRAMLLFSGPAQVVELLQVSSFALKEVNIGGMHYAMGTFSLGRLMTFTDADRNALKELRRLGVGLDVRATPWDERLDLTVELQ